MAYADYKDLMELTETMVSGMVKHITGGYKITYHPNQTDAEKGEPMEVDFTPPFKKVSMLSELEKVLNVEIPSPTTFSTEGKEKLLVKMCITHVLICQNPRRVYGKVKQSMYGNFRAKTLLNP